MLELKRNDILKRQIDLVTYLVTSTEISLAVLQELGPCRVWMRLCLMIGEAKAQECAEQVERLLSTKPWENELIWSSIKPGLIFWSLKQPKLSKEIFTPSSELETSAPTPVPLHILDEMREESKKFDLLFK